MSKKINIPSIVGDVVITSTGRRIENIIGAYNVNSGIKTTIINPDTNIQALDSVNFKPITLESFIKAPYINTEYYNPIHYLGENLEIQYYVMDSEQEDYYKNSYDKDFLVEVEFNNTIFKRKVKAGNHKINLGKVNSLGETYFVIKATDLSNGYQSCCHYKHLMVVNKDTHAITPSQTYTMTATDLTTYSIVTGTNITNDVANKNMAGIQNLLNAVRKQGYRKIVFYNPGGNTSSRTVYALQPYDSREYAITIPNGLTLDMNHCKFKQLLSYGAQSLLMNFEKDSNDTHLTNGFIEGDYDVHIVDKKDPNYGGTFDSTQIAPIEGEGYNLLHLNGAFNSMTNMDISYGTGYTVIYGDNNMVYSNNAIRNHTNVYINESGQEIVSDSNIWTSPFQELTSSMLAYRYIQINPFNSYGLLAGASNDEIIIYYDVNKNYIKQEKVRQFGLSKIPSGAKYVRVTMCGEYDSVALTNWVLGVRIEAKNYKPSTCWLSKDNYIHDCRTVAYALGTYNHFLLENNTITNCGQNLGVWNGQVTAVAIDCEEGFRQGEALYFKDIKCTKGAKGMATVLILMGYDVHVYGENIMDFHPKKIFGLNLHDTSISEGLTVYRLNKDTTGFMMIYNNNIGGQIWTHYEATDTTTPNLLIKNCEINSQINSLPSLCKLPEKLTFKNCNITRQPRGTLTVLSEEHENCTISLAYKHYLAGNSKYKNCILKNTGTSSDIGIAVNASDLSIDFTNCDIEIPLLTPGVTNIGNTNINLTKCKVTNNSFDVDYVTKK